jgi:hypothetical protein
MRSIDEWKGMAHLSVPVLALPPHTSGGIDDALSVHAVHVPGTLFLLRIRQQDGNSQRGKFSRGSHYQIL